MYIPIEKTGICQKQKSKKITDHKHTLIRPRLRNNSIISFLHNFFICLLFIIIGWFITSFSNNFSESVIHANRYFDFLSDSDNYGFIYKLIYLIRRDVITLLLIFISSLTFFHNALCTCLLGLNGLIYGICTRISLLSVSRHSNMCMLYIYEISTILLLFIFAVSLTSKSNLEFIKCKQRTKDCKNGIYISPEFKRLILRMFVIITIYIVDKIIFCFLYSR